MSEHPYAARLAKLIVSGGEKVLQKIICSISMASSQPLASFLDSKFEEIKSLHEKGFITEEQMQNLFPSDQNLPKVETFDYRLLILLLTTVCDLQQPRRGWKILPLSLDDTLEAKLARLITYQYMLCDDCKHPEAIDNKTFDMYVHDIESALKALGLTDEEVKTLTAEPVNNSKELEMLLQWAREEESVERKHFQDLEELKRTQDNLQAILSNQETLQHVLSNAKKVENITLYTSKENEIGTGSKGTVVYRGFFGGEEVAVKKALTAMCSVEEIKLLKKLKHPHIINCLDSAKSEEFTYLALELCKGTLAQCIKKDLFKTELSLNQLDCLEQIAEGVSFLHEQRVCHRDIKPENILVTFGDDSNNMRFVLADFSIARKVKNESFSTSKSIAGTDGWIAQEHYQPGQTPSLKVDIFSLGCVCFYVITNGCHPFGKIADLKKCQSKINTKVPAVHLFNLNDACNELGNLVYAMVDANPENRPTAKDVCNKLKIINSEVITKVSNSEGEQNQHDARIRLNFKVLSSNLRQSEELQKGFSQCRERFLRGELGHAPGDNPEESLKHRFLLLMYEILIVVKNKQLKSPLIVVKNPEEHGIHFLYQKDYLGESFPEKDIKEALKMKLRERAFQDLANNFDRLKWSFIQEFKNLKRFWFYEVAELAN